MARFISVWTFLKSKHFESFCVTIFYLSTKFADKDWKFLDKSKNLLMLKKAFIRQHRRRKMFLDISTTPFKYYPIQQAKQFRKSLKSEKERLGESFEIKLRRAQGLYESELTAAKVCLFYRTYINFYKNISRSASLFTWITCFKGPWRWTYFVVLRMPQIL